MTVERQVPCNGCTLCCWNDAVFLHAEKGDDIRRYSTTLYRGRPILEHKPDGSCLYLGEHGCTIHNDRPVICREFDCRKIVADIPRSQLRRLEAQGALRSEVLTQGRRLLGRLP